MLDQGCVDATESFVVPLLREDLGLEPMERRGERHARLSPLARGQHPKRRVLGQPLRVVRVLVPGQAAIDGLAKEIWQRELVVASGARIGEMLLDQGAQAETLVQLAWQQQPGVGGHRGSPELDAKLRIEREANRARFRVTHWVVPSAPARSPREPHFLRVWRDYGLICSPLKTKMRVESCRRREALNLGRWSCPLEPLDAQLR